MKFLYLGMGIIFAIVALFLMFEFGEKIGYSRGIETGREFQKAQDKEINH